ncbi:MAG: hypothetical protein ABIE84_06830 [bacterium]
MSIELSITTKVHRQAVLEGRLSGSALIGTLELARRTAPIQQLESATIILLYEAFLWHLVHAPKAEDRMMVMTYLGDNIGGFLEDLVNLSATVMAEGPSPAAVENSQKVQRLAATSIMLGTSFFFSVGQAESLWINDLFPEAQINWYASNVQAIKRGPLEFISFNAALEYLDFDNCNPAAIFATPGLPSAIATGLRLSVEGRTPMLNDFFVPAGISRDATLCLAELRKAMVARSRNIYVTIGRQAFSSSLANPAIEQVIPSQPEEEGTTILTMPYKEKADDVMLCLLVKNELAVGYASAQRLAGSTTASFGFHIFREFRGAPSTSDAFFIGVEEAIKSAYQPHQLVITLDGPMSAVESTERNLAFYTRHHYSVVSGGRQAIKQVAA